MALMELVPKSFNLELKHCAFHSTICLNYVWVVAPSEWKIHQITPILKLVIDRVSTTTGQFHYCVALLRLWNVPFLTKLLVSLLIKSQFSSLDLFSNELIISPRNTKILWCNLPRFQKGIQQCPHTGNYYTSWSRLKLVGILGSLWKWFENYLTSR